VGTLTLRHVLTKENGPLPEFCANSAAQLEAPQKISSSN